LKHFKKVFFSCSFLFFYWELFPAFNFSWLLFDFSCRRVTTRNTRATRNAIRNAEIIRDGYKRAGLSPTHTSTHLTHQLTALTALTHSRHTTIHVTTIYHYLPAMPFRGMHTQHARSTHTTAHMCPRTHSLGHSLRTHFASCHAPRAITHHCVPPRTMHRAHAQCTTH